MHVVAIGLNYRTAPVEVREKFVISAEAMPKALLDLKNRKSVLECVILSTCNRTEIYAVVDKLERCGYYIREFIADIFGIPKEQFKDYLYTLEEKRAIQHLFRVAVGLDSMVIGETQILGQVKDAFLLAQDQKATGTWFNELFKQVITLAKRAHHETSIGENSVSVSYAAVELGKRIFSDYRGKKAIILGAGEMSELTIKHLKAGGIEELFVLNRTYESAVDLAGQFGGTAMPWERMESCLAEADVLISSTSAPGYVLTKDMLERALMHRKSRPLFMLDIAVPRDLDPAIGDLSNVFLYDIDDLQSIVESHLAERRIEAQKIEEMIAAEMDQFEAWKRMIGVAPVIHALQMKAQLVHQETMESLFNKLPDLGEREAKVIRKLTKSIVNQMLRDPILRIKEMSAERNGDEALDYFSKIFALETLLAQEEQAKAEDEQASDLKHGGETAGWGEQNAKLALQ